MKVDVLISLRIVSLAILDWTLENNLLHSSEILFAASFQKLIDLINLDSEILAAVTCVVTKHQSKCWHHIFNCTSVSVFVCECVGWCQWQREEDAAAICKLFSTCELLFIVQGFSLASAPTFSQYHLKSERNLVSGEKQSQLIVFNLISDVQPLRRASFIYNLYYQLIFAN